MLRDFTNAGTTALSQSPVWPAYVPHTQTSLLAEILLPRLDVRPARLNYTLGKWNSGKEQASLACHGGHHRLRRLKSARKCHVSGFVLRTYGGAPRDYGGHGSDLSSGYSEN